MEHQDTKLTSMCPRLKELNDIPYFNSGAKIRIIFESAKEMEKIMII